MQLESTSTLSKSAKTILIIEDDDGIREVVEELLRIEGFFVTSFSNGHEGLAYLGKAKTLPSLLLLDMMMPEMTGPQCLEALRKMDSIPRKPSVLIFSASHLSQDKIDSLGVAGFIKKPICDIDHFLVTIRTFADAIDHVA